MQGMFQMGADKSPSPDALNLGFFQHFCLVVGPQVMHHYRLRLESGELPDSANDTIVVLIPKVNSPSSMKDLRPISLCNVIFKIV